MSQFHISPIGRTICSTWNSIQGRKAALSEVSQIGICSTWNPYHLQPLLSSMNHQDTRSDLSWSESVASFLATSPTPRKKRPRSFEPIYISLLCTRASFKE